MAESIYRGIQLGKESVFGTEVDATTIYPTDEGSGEMTTNRATEIPEEDFGMQVAHLGGRASHGVQMATGTLASQARFEDLGQMLRMMYAAPSYSTVAIDTSSIANPSVITTLTAHGLVTGQTVTIAGHTSVTPDINGNQVVTVLTATTFSIPVNVTDGGTGGTVTTGTQVYTAGTTTTTYESMTYEVNNDTQDMISTGTVVTGLDLGFDEIGPGENVMWTVSADLQAALQAKGTATAALTIPTVLETIEGHLTTLNQGTTATAFASLGALSAHLVSYRQRGEQEKPLRPYGSATDVASAIGLRKRKVTVNAMLKFSATTVSDIWDIFTVAGSLPTERRWRITATGSANKTLKIDHRLLFTDVHLEPDGRNGEYLVSVEGLATYDSTLATDQVITITGASLPALA